MRASKLLLPLFLLFAACKSDVPPANSTGRSPVEAKELLRQNDSLRSVIAALKGELTAGSTATEASKTLLRYELPTHPVELGDYLEKGQSALMPAGGTTLGGELHIETALPLQGNHVFVTGSDGHNYRYWLLQYTAAAGKPLQWQRVWTGNSM